MRNFIRNIAYLFKNNLSDKNNATLTLQGTKLTGVLGDHLGRNNKLGGYLYI